MYRSFVILNKAIYTKSLESQMAYEKYSTNLSPVISLYMYRANTYTVCDS